MALEDIKTEFKVGPLTINLRILLEPKGFLKIILLVVVLLAFSITAGFNSIAPNDNRVDCFGFSSNNITLDRASISFWYPYDTFHFTYSPQPPNISQPICSPSPSRPPFSSSAQFFVAMGVLSMVYVIVALIVYILFITPDLSLAKWLVIGDFFATIVFGVFYVIADIAWSAGIAQLATYVGDQLRLVGVRCLMCNSIEVQDSIIVQTFAQPAISVIIGWLAAFIWFSSVWFVYKDTMWHKDKTGPLAPLYHIGEKSTEEGGAETQGQSE